MKLTNEELTKIQSIIIEKITKIENVVFTSNEEIEECKTKVKELNNILDKLGAMKV
jgi:hypothetical protein